SVDIEVTPESLLAARVVRRKAMPVKILGDGEIAVALMVKAHKFSAIARQKIEAAGGTAVELPWAVERHSRSRGANFGGRNAKKKAQA
ncbi:MAG: 50S ribosomal protein L15, partial [Oscillochloris sp.]|nr:50S ribosomal protein L15 [Oscillochloris sp.]